MKILEKVKTICYHYIKRKYNKYLNTNNKKKMEKDDITAFTTDLLDNKKNECMDYIFNRINNIQLMSKNSTEEKYDEEEIREIIEEIIEDRELLINRVSLEIENYQKSKNSKKSSDT
jgi:hypothetical protein